MKTEIYNVAQMYPNAESNTITIKLTIVRRTPGSFSGFHQRIMNGKVLETMDVTSYDELKAFRQRFRDQCEQLQLTEIDESVQSLKGY